MLQKNYFQYLHQYKWPILIFFLLWFIYNLNFKAVFSGDVYGTSVIPLSIIQYHTIAIDNYYPLLLSLFQADNAPIYGITFFNNHYYSSYPIVLSILVTPLYFVMYHFLCFLNIIIDPSDPKTFFIIYFMQKITASGLISAVVVLMYYTLKRIFLRETALLSSFIFAFCTLTWAVSSQSLWQQCLIEFLLVIIIYLLIKNNYAFNYPSLCLLGIISGLFFFGRPSDSVLLIPLFALIVFLPWKKIFTYIFFFAIVSLPFLYYNYSIFNSIFGGYNALLSSYELNSVIIIHIIALLISPSRGLFIYSPILLLMIPGFIIAIKTNNKKERLFYYTIGISIISSIILYGSFHCWYAGWSYGPRFLVGMIPYCILLISFSLNKFLSIKIINKKNILTFFLIFLLLFFSFFVEVIGSYHIDRGSWDSKFNFEDSNTTWNWKDNQILYTFYAGPNLWFLNTDALSTKYQEKINLLNTTSG